MKSPRAVPMFLATAALCVGVFSASAQRGAGGAHGGMAPGGMGPATHAGVTPGAHSGSLIGGPAARFGGPGAAGSGLSVVPNSRSGISGARSLFPSPGITSTRPVYYSNGIRRYGDTNRRGERGGYNGLGIVSFAYPGIYPGYLGFGYDPEFLDATENPNNLAATGDPNFALSSYGPMPDSLANQQPGMPDAGDDRGGLSPEPMSEAPTNYVSAPESHRAVSAAAAAPLPEEDAVTIIFKDGRAPEQIRNYALTRTALYVTAGRVRTIPINQIDLAATEKVNEQAGVEFRLPTNR